MMWMCVGLSMAQDAAVTGGAIPELNAQLFDPSVDARSTLWTDDSQRAPDGYTSARVVLHYMNSPFVYEDVDGNETDLVAGVWQTNVLAAHTRGPLRLGVDVPLYLRSNGDLGGETGLGDLALDLKLSALDRSERVVGVGVGYRMSLPTATVDAPLGNGAFGWDLGLIVDKELGEKTLLAANLGTRGVNDQQLENIEYRDQFTWRLGAGYALNEATGLSLDLARHRTYGAGSETAGRPLEAMVGAHRRFGDLVARGGLGVGLTEGIGAPKYRLVFSFGWEKPFVPPDTDLDGLLDDVDQCIELAEDFDGVADDDGCPEMTRVTVKVVDPSGADLPGATWTAGEFSGAGGEGFEAFDGELEVAATHPDGIPASVTLSVAGEAVTATVELAPIPGTLLVSGVDEEGNPVPELSWRAGDHRGTTDPVELPPGDYTVVVKAPGYKPKKEPVTVTKETEEVVQLVLEPSKAKVTAEKIDISESVFFETGKDVIKEESFDLLNDVAALLDAHPEITKLRIEGHTDDRGDDEMNQDLSERRAASVKRYLEEQGVDAGRLDSAGFGETKPIDSNKTKAGRAKNRRVDFFVAERSDD